MRVAPRVCTSSEARSGGPPVHKCGVDATQQLREQVGGTTPAMLNYMLSAMDTGMGYAVASFESSQRFAMDHWLDRGRDARYRAPPAQIPACAINALGSYLGYLTAIRSSGQG
jgi:hypothetical protein